jgi:quercetin dioxygenase-like cupin family protein
MITATPSGASQAEDPDRRIDGPFVSFDVPFELARLRAERAYHVEGHVGRTLTKYPDLRVVLEAMKAGERLPLHETAERMTLQVLVGQIRVWTEYGRNHDLSEGSYAAIDAARIHEIECLHESGFLLTLAWPPVGTGRREADEEEVGGAGI